MKSSVLYISYDGILEPLGQSQVLSYLERLAPERPIHLVSFEKAGDWKSASSRAEITERIRAAGIHWYPRRYHKRPSALATSYDIFVGLLTGWWLLVRHGIRIVHARSYVPAVMALILQKTTGARFVFDMRGFWAAERVDGGLWPSGSWLFRVATWFERRFLLNADIVVSLTEAGLAAMRGFPFLTGRFPSAVVIPTCTDLNRFRPRPEGQNVPADHPFVLGYVGSVSTWYLLDEMLAFFGAIRSQRPEARMLIVNRNEHEYIWRRIEASGLPSACFDVRSASHAEMAKEIQRMNAGIFFYRPSFSRLATAPTKMGEFLACGVPCVGNSGVGDVADVLARNSVGVVVHRHDPEAYRNAVSELMALCQSPETRYRCVDAARRQFSLAEGALRYSEVYASLDP